MHYEQEEFHNLQTGDHFAFDDHGTIEGTLFDVVDGSYIDHWGNRLVMYQATDGLHGHAADHTTVWTLSP